mmetsp:Transcript_7145/g.18292  ORF Transcript_7145/g.18292 Transcript_7145/m.18292 type:complete len:215 (-) Transcript_7145:625-1269(-)
MMSHCVCRGSHAPVRRCTRNTASTCSPTTGRGASRCARRQMERSATRSSRASSRPWKRVCSLTTACRALAASTSICSRRHLTAPALRASQTCSARPRPKTSTAGAHSRSSRSAPRLSRYGATSSSSPSRLRQWRYASGSSPLLCLRTPAWPRPMSSTQPAQCPHRAIMESSRWTRLPQTTKPAAHQAHLMTQTIWRSLMTQTTTGARTNARRMS